MRIWDASSGTELLDFVAHGATVRAAIFSPDGKQVVSCSKAEVHVWDSATGKLLASLTVPAGGTGLAFSPDGQRLAVVGTDKQTRVLDVAANKVLFTVPAEAAAFSPAGKLLATAAESVVLRDAGNGKELHKLDGAGANVSSLCFSRDGSRLLASGGKTLAVVVWDVAGHQVLFNQKLWVTAALSPDGQRLAAGGDRQVRFWDLKTGSELSPLHGLDHWVIGLAYSPDGKSFATATGEPLTGVQELDDNSPFAMFVKMMVPAALPERAALEVRVWDAAAAQEGRPLMTGKAPGVFAFRRDGLLAIGLDGAIELWVVGSLCVAIYRVLDNRRNRFRRDSTGLAVFRLGQTASTFTPLLALRRNAASGNVLSRHDPGIVDYMLPRMDAPRVFGIRGHKLDAAIDAMRPSRPITSSFKP